MIKENFFEVSRVLSKLENAYNKSQNIEFKKLWLNKWNDYAKQNSSSNFKPRDFDLEQEFNVDNDNKVWHI